MKVSSPIRFLFCTATALATVCMPMAGANAQPRHPIALHPGMVVGKVAFHNGDTNRGGQWQHLDGIQADVGAVTVYHVHVHLSLFHDGKQIAVPKEIGILNLHVKNGQGKLEPITAYYWLHTHDMSGIVHVESPLPPTQITFKLGDFFDIWGEPLRTNDLAGWAGKVTVFVDGKKFHGNPRNIVLRAHEQITLEVGSPIVSPPTYTFPAGY